MNRLSDRGLLTVVCITVWIACTLAMGLINKINPDPRPQWSEEIRMIVEAG